MLDLHSSQVKLLMDLQPLSLVWQVTHAIRELVKELLGILLDHV